MTDRYAVVGNPVAHSKSPQIHSLFARQTGQAIRYDKLLAPLDGFGAALEEFQRSGGRGLNVTVPFKQQAVEHMAALSRRAEAAGAVNTVLIDRTGRRYGDNTDGVGLVRDLRNNHGVSLARSRLLVLGAGGAVRGVLPALLDELPAEVVIANRTVARAKDLADRFHGAIPLAACGFDELAGESFDLVINGTSAGLHGDLPPLPEGLLRTGAVCYDMVYGDQLTVFQRWARANGAHKALSGLGMLVEQAAESFYLWREVSPDTAPVIQVLAQAGAAE